MKAYPVHEGELSQLSTLSGLAAVFFSVSAGLLGFSIDIHKDLDLATASDLTEGTIAYWDAIRTGTFVGAIITFVAGGITFYLRGGVVKKIKEGTRFPTDVSG